MKVNVVIRVDDELHVFPVTVKVTQIVRVIDWLMENMLLPGVSVATTLSEEPTAIVKFKVDPFKFKLPRSLAFP